MKEKENFFPSFHKVILMLVKYWKKLKQLGKHSPKGRVPQLLSFSPTSTRVTMTYGKRFLCLKRAMLCNFSIFLKAER